jgi:hypothetical protein
VSQLNHLKAQSLFSAPDTVCVRQPVRLTSNTTASTYYWGFCSGYLKNGATGADLGSGFSFNGADAIEIAKDGSNYYGFVANAGSRELLRLNFGASLNNVPTVTNLGNLNNTVPQLISSLSIVKDSNRWYMFAAGGSTSANASFARFDFGASLANTPNSVNFGNPGNLMKQPVGISVAYDGFNWYGYMADKQTNELLRLNFGNNISLTPILTTWGNVGTLSGPSDLVLVKESGNWFILATNETTSTLSLISFGANLASIPAGNNLGSIGNKLFGPSGITLIKDCGSYYAFVTDRLANDITRIEIPSFTGAYSATLLGNTSGLAGPSAIATMIRDRDNLYTFVTNAGNNLSQITFAQCTNSSIPSSASATPPAYSYDVPGIYNVYLATNEGLPTMAVDCKQIVVLPIPSMSLRSDTVLCQGDTITLFAQGYQATYKWRPYYNISDTQGFKVRAWPEYSLSYYVTLTYPNGCIVDTPIHIDVSKVKADAGPDRIIADGASTLLGGPLTSTAGSYTYTWSPGIFLDNTTLMNPRSTPAYDITYYLTVLELNDNLGCTDIDTVIVHVSCNDLNLPNAFVPEAKVAGANRFGLLNWQIIKLNYFRVFDRWGKEVFTTSDPSKQWDGTINGDPAPFGVYVWEADGFCSEGRRFTKSGNVTLIR